MQLCKNIFNHFLYLKIMKTKTTFFSLLLVILSSSIFAQTGSIEVKINGIENNDGVVMIGLYNSEADFPDSDKGYTGAAPKANTNGVTHTFSDIPAGKYAIAVWHDEDEDKELDKNFLGIPRENYGFSNNAFGTFGPPGFKDAAFNVVSGETTELEITLK